MSQWKAKSYQSLARYDKQNSPIYNIVAKEIASGTREKSDIDVMSA